MTKKIGLRIAAIIAVCSLVLVNAASVFATSNKNFTVDQSKIEKFDTSYYVGERDGADLYQQYYNNASIYVAIKESNIYQNHTPTYIYKTGSPLFYQQMYPRYVSSIADQEYWRYDFDVSIYDNGYFFDLTGLDDNFRFYLQLKFNYRVTSGSVRSYLTPVCTKYTVSYYDASGNYLSSQTSTNIETSLSDRQLNIDATMHLTRPTNAKYCSMGLSIEDFGFAGDNAVTMEFRLMEFYFQVGSPVQIVPQNYQDWGYPEEPFNGYRWWYIDSQDGIASTYLTSTGTGEPAISGSYNTLRFFARSGENYEYQPRFRMWYPNKFLKLNNIPSGSEITVSFSYTLTAPENFYYPNAYVLITYWDSEFNQLTSYNQRHTWTRLDYEKHPDGSGGSMSQDFTLEYPAEAMYMTVYCNLQDLYFFGSSTNIPVVIEGDINLAIRELVPVVDFPTGDKFDDLSGSLEVNRPDIDGIDTNISGLVDMNYFLLLTDTLGEFWESDLLVSILVAAVTLMLISWVLFGQKG